MPELPPSIPTQTLRRDLAELGPILHFNVAADHVTLEGRTRVYRVKGKDMVEFYTVRYGADAKILALDQVGCELRWFFPGIQSTYRRKQGIRTPIALKFTRSDRRMHNLLNNIVVLCLQLRL